jgi:hypothetical protein
MSHRSRVAATAALIGFVVASVSGCSAGNPVAPSLSPVASEVGSTMEVAKQTTPFDSGIRGTDGGDLGSSDGAQVAPKIRKPKKPKHPRPTGG